MKIVLATVGSRGDVQPMMALSLALKARGNEVLLAGPPERARWAEALGCPYTALGRDVMAFVEAGRSTRTPAAAFAFHRFLQGEIRRQFRALPGLIAGADLVVGASLCFGLASVAEAMKIRYRFIAFTPQLLPSGHHPCPVFKSQRLPVALNRAGWWMATAVDRLHTTRLINRYRRRLGLKPVGAANASYLGERVVVASDKALATVPPDVTRGTIQTGYMHLRQPLPNLPALDRFLEDGDPPIYIGFGSMPRAEQAVLMPRVIQAACIAGARVVMGWPWRGPAEKASGKDVFVVRQYPHEVLFPRMAAVVHHGGAGTTATAAASGVLQIIVPHILDQYFWAERVYRTGIGPEPIRRSRLTGRSGLTVRKLARDIERCTASCRMKQSARTIRDDIAGVDAVEMTVADLLADFED